MRGHRDGVYGALQMIYDRVAVTVDFSGQEGREAMNVLSAIGVADTEVQRLAPRMSSLAGRRIGVLDNSKPNADALLGRVAERLVERAGAAVIRVWRKPGASLPAADLDEVAAGADAVLTGSAD